jgi:glycerol kinase
MNGLLGLGVYRSLKELAAIPRAVKGFRPKMKVAEVKRLHDGWLAAVKRVL